MKTDPPHILCVNPWIHDFAAFDFWAKPLGLLSIAAILRKNSIRISYLDCMDRFHPKAVRPVKTLWDGRGPFRKKTIPFPKDLKHLLPDMGQPFSRYGIEPDWFYQDLSNLPKPDLIFVTSLMTYWATGVRETIETIKKVFPDVPVLLGGIYAGLCQDHATAYSLADRVVTGPGEERLCDLVKEFTGFDLEFVPDPGDLDTYPYPALDLCRHLAYAPILTSRGCPFSCEYCAASFLEPFHRRRSPDHVFKEILHWHREYKVKNFAFYDDALLVNAKSHAFPLFEHLIDSNIKVNFHTPNAIHIREITPKAADLMFRAGFATIRLGLETTNFSPDRHHDIKVKKDEFFTAVENLKSAGFKAGQLGAYLLCGLPGQDLEQVAASMALVKKTGILPVLAYYTPIPHTPMWEDAVKHALFDITKHPVFTNNTLFPCVKSDTDRNRISQLKKMKN
ncbi:MAG: radical SAM protein [Proteobacteria bacterium]|nr:B12-binding domain-containing radical SAM protein [Desulfobacula sp.]MBU4131037.1 radical SAM protein [Pseudomonadota bacterium]